MELDEAIIFPAEEADTNTFKKSVYVFGGVPPFIEIVLCPVELYWAVRVAPVPEPGVASADRVQDGEPAAVL